MADSRTALIVGGGATAARAVAGLRDGGFDGQILLLAAERQLPYDWSVLTEDVLAGRTGERPLHPLSEAQYAAAGVDLRLGTPATALDPAARQVTLATGTTLGYDLALLATGTQAQAPDGEAHALTGFDAVSRLRDAYSRGGHVVVSGGGWGAHAAVEAARHWGAAVSWLVPDAAPLVGALGVEGGGIIADLHRDNGVDVQLGVSDVAPAEGGVRMSDGTVLRADAVVLAADPQPAVGLAVGAGLAVDEGVLVDGSFRTSDPAVYAAGSVASQLYPGTPGGPSVRLRLDGWQDGAEQGYAAGLAMARRANSSGQEPAANFAGAGSQPHYRRRLYGTLLEFWGTLAQGYDQVVFRGEDEGEDDESLEEFCAFWLRNGRVVAAMDLESGEAGVGRLPRSPAVVDATKLADRGTPLESFL